MTLEKYTFSLIQKNSEEFIYSHDIPEYYQVSAQIYDNLLIELQDLFDELRDEWKANNSDVWTNLTFKRLN